MRRFLIMCSALFFVSIGWPVGSGSSYGIQLETQEEKAANLKQQATGGLFQKWTFDQDQIDHLPEGFEQDMSNESSATWAVQTSTTAPSLPNVVVGSSRCGELCFQVLLAKELEYEYPDLTVRFQAPDGAGAGGVVLGAHDAKNFYAAVVDSVQRKAHLLRISNGRIGCPSLKRLSTSNGLSGIPSECNEIPSSVRILSKSMSMGRSCSRLRTKRWD